MVKVCYVCKIIYGEKAPFNDHRETHGICPACLPWELEKLRKWVEERKEQNETLQMGKTNTKN